MTRIQILLGDISATDSNNIINNNNTSDNDIMIVVAETNSFLRRVLYEQIDERFSGRVIAKKNDLNQLCVYKTEGMMMMLVMIVMMVIGLGLGVRVW